MALVSSSGKGLNRTENIAGLRTLLFTDLPNSFSCIQSLKGELRFALIWEGSQFTFTVVTGII